MEEVETENVKFKREKIEQLQPMRDLTLCPADPGETFRVL
jgi:hypothetical protein